MMETITPPWVSADVLDLLERPTVHSSAKNTDYDTVLQPSVHDTRTVCYDCVPLCVAGAGGGGCLRVRVVEVEVPGRYYFGSCHVC